MPARPAPPPLLIADIPCPMCRLLTCWDDQKHEFSCRCCGLIWDTTGAAVGDEVPGRWVGTEPTQHNALNVPEQEEQP